MAASVWWHNGRDGLKRHADTVPLAETEGISQSIPHKREENEILDDNGITKPPLINYMPHLKLI